MNYLSHWAIASFAACFASVALSAQCITGWKAGEIAPGPYGGTGMGTSCWWDPDGSGPQTSQLVLGGSFTMPSLEATNLVMFDPSSETWRQPPGRPDGLVSSLTVLQNGNLALCGTFTAIDGIALPRLAIWDGSQWTAPAGNVTGNFARIARLLVMPNGDLVVGGSFQTIGGISANGLARWDGSQWHAYGAFAGDVQCLAVRPNGNLIVGGQFAPIGQNGFANIAEWNGTNWLHYGTGLGSNYSYTQAIAVLDNGDVVAQGFFNSAGGVYAPRIARWDGSSWSAMDTTFDGAPVALLPMPGGALLAASVTSVNLVPILGVALWTGSQWQSFAPGIGTIGQMTFLPNGDLLVVGNLDTQGGNAVCGIARWDGQAWHALGRGFDAEVTELLALPNGDLFARGTFTRAPGRLLRSLALRSADAWWPLTTYTNPLPGQWSSTNCAALDTNGDLWVGGSTNTWNVGAAIARQTPGGWVPVGMGVQTVNCMLVENGRPTIGTPGFASFVGHWSGTAWITYGQTFDGSVRTLLRLRNGDLIAGGDFLASGTTPVSRIARWDGTAWQPFAQGVDGPVRALAQLPNGDLIAAGEFLSDGLRPLNLIARWNGTGWEPLGAGLAGNPGASVRSLLVLPNGDLLAGGDFAYADGYPAHNIARWDGSHWTAENGGTDGPVNTLAQLPDGDVYAGGNFSMAGPTPSAHFALLRSNCAAANDVYGTGCEGTAGTLALEASSRPWIGSTYRSTCYGVSPTGIGLDLFGVSPIQSPLSSLHPAAGPNCQLLLQPLAVTLRTPTLGTIESAFQLPNDPALAGTKLHQQMLVAEVNGAFAITSLASSNGTTLTVGTL